LRYSNIAIVDVKKRSMKTFDGNFSSCFFLEKFENSIIEIHIAVLVKKGQFQVLRCIWSEVTGFEIKRIMDVVQFKPAFSSPSL
jgi:hypothetical protein